MKVLLIYSKIFKIIKKNFINKIIEYKEIYSNIKITKCTKEERKITENTTLEVAKRTRESYYYYLRHRFNMEFINDTQNVDYLLL